VAWWRRKRPDNWKAIPEGRLFGARGDWKIRVLNQVAVEETVKKLALSMFVTAIVILAAWTLYEMAPGHFTDGQSTIPTLPGWVSHKDPQGFSVNLPQAWTARADRTSGRIELFGGEKEQMFIWPVFVPAPMDSTIAGILLGKLSTKFWPDARWETAQPCGARAVRMRGISGNRTTVAIFTWTPSPKGSAGFVYAMAAPSNRYPLRETTFAAILESFRIVGATPTKDQPPPLSFVRWQDSRENAFSAEVPAQWRTNGGLFRFASVDTRFALESISPDDQIRMTVGDAEIPPFTLPSPMLQMAGFGEGSWYSPGYGLRMMVRRYAPGAAFAKEYVAGKTARDCSNLNFVDTRDRSDAVEAINAINARYNNLGVSSTLHAGEVAFTCQKNGQTMEGYYFAGTRLTHSYGSGLWNVEYLSGYLASSAKRELAQTALEHLLTTFQVNPQWAAMQQNIAASTSRIVAETNETITKMMSESFWNKRRSEDEISRRRSNAMLGVEDVIDPVTGREFKVQSGSNYVWVDQHGMIIGTQTDTRPNLDFRELVRLP
jgi:hypothetical protein